MRIRTRIFLAMMLVVGVGFYFLLDWVTDDLEPRYRESTEEPLVDAARVLAALASSQVRDGMVDTRLFRDSLSDIYNQDFSARIYEFTKTRVDFRIYITDQNGVVIFDSQGRDEGKDYSNWRDVSLTLLGEYGARTSRNAPDFMDSSVMYVGAPIVWQGETIGVLSVGKPTRTAKQLEEAARRKIFIAGGVIALVMLLVSLFVSNMLTRPLMQLIEYAGTVRDGKRATLPTLSSGEIGELGAAFEEMRTALEGKQYVENYVQTLTHELKSPLSAIQGAAELLQEEMPAERRRGFLNNIRNEAKRIEQVVEKLLLLASLENRRDLSESSVINLSTVLDGVKDALSPLIEKKSLKLEVGVVDNAATIGEEFLIRHALSNLLLNAIEFSPTGGTITIKVTMLDNMFEIRIEDQGPGLPAYALERAFERFFSLQRPDTGRKSSGLGLTLVREVADLHGGAATLANRENGGCVARLVLPAAAG
jgi:two-component system sensor histidine kinase CreC